MQLQILLLVIVSVINNPVDCETIETKSTQLQGKTLLPKQRDADSYLGLVSCAMRYDVSCFLDTAQNYLEGQKTQLLAEADVAAERSYRRSDPDSKPSQLSQTLSRLLSEFNGLFKDGLISFFKESRGADDRDDDSEQNQLSTADANGAGRAARGKKHKQIEGIIKKIVRVVKSAIYALTLLLMQLSVLMMFNSFVGFKFLLVAMWGVGLLALKVYLTYKKEGGTVVVHEDVHHDHHYEDHDHITVDDWHRNYLPKQDYAQKLAYSAQKPAETGWSSWLN